jgi:hypothetical protein
MEWCESAAEVEAIEREGGILEQELAALERGGPRYE